jgi:hypothetical protein
MLFEPVWLEKLHLPLLVADKIGSQQSISGHSQFTAVVSHKNLEVALVEQESSKLFHATTEATK